MNAPKPRHDVDALKRAHPLVDLLQGRGIALRRSGADRYTARCPFHDDHEPSLFVDGRDQHFHCFGCGAHGDVLDFLMRADGLGFATACDRLAGLPVQSVAHHRMGKPADHPRRWDRLGLEEQVVLNTAAALYQHTLWREPRALAYVRDRGIPDWVTRSCALGFADGHSLEAYLRRRTGLRTAEQLGLLRRPGRDASLGTLREFFAGRIVVPERRGGNCIWLIGRRLDEEGQGPKYLALGGERPILGFERAAGQREVFLCEGVYDWLTAVSWRLPACCALGTALAPDRFGFLARAAVVYGVLDGDAAGAKAAADGAAIFQERWRSIPLPDGCDLNDLGRRPDGRAHFFDLLRRHRATTLVTPEPRNRTGGDKHAHRD
jgi:DNA primase